MSASHGHDMLATTPCWAPHLTGSTSARARCLRDDMGLCDDRRAQAVQ